MKARDRFSFDISQFIVCDSISFTLLLLFCACSQLLTFFCFLPSKLSSRLMWLNSLVSLPRGPFTITVRPFNLTSTAKEGGKAWSILLYTSWARLSSQTKKGKKKFLTIVGEVDSLAAENGLHSTETHNVFNFSICIYIIVYDYT